MVAPPIGYPTGGWPRETSPTLLSAAPKVWYGSRYVVNAQLTPAVFVRTSRRTLLAMANLEPAAGDGALRVDEVVHEDRETVDVREVVVHGRRGVQDQENVRVRSRVGLQQLPVVRAARETPSERAAGTSRPRGVARRIRRALETSDGVSWRFSSEGERAGQRPGLDVGDESLGVLEESVILRAGRAHFEAVEVLGLVAGRIALAAEAQAPRDAAGSATTLTWMSSVPKKPVPVTNRWLGIRKSTLPAKFGAALVPNSGR